LRGGGKNAYLCGKLLGYVEEEKRERPPPLLMTRCHPARGIEEAQKADQDRQQLREDYCQEEGLVPRRELIQFRAEGNVRDVHVRQHPCVEQKACHSAAENVSRCSLRAGGQGYLSPRALRR